MNSALDSARAGITSRSAAQRLRAIAALQSSGSSEASELLIPALRDRLSYVGAAAARALAAIAAPSMAAALVDHFAWAQEQGADRDPGCTVRIELAGILGSLRHSPAEAVLRAGLWTTQIEMVGMGLADTAVGLRSACALALGSLRPPSVVIDLSLLLFDAGPMAQIPTDTLPVRRDAARAIGILGDPAGSSPLILALRSRTQEDPDVLVECMSSLALLEEPRLLEFLCPFLEASEPFLAAGAAMSLGRSRLPAALAPLLSCFDRAAGALVDAVALAVAALGTSAARDALLQRAAADSPVKRSAAAAALGRFPDADTRAALTALASNDGDEKVRMAARRTLGSIR